MYSIGKKVRAIRLTRGISQKEFARLINAKNTTVSNWEKGLTRPNVDMLAAICEVLEVSPNELLDIRLSSEGYTEREKLLIERYRQKPEFQEAINVLLGINTWHS